MNHIMSMSSTAFVFVFMSTLALKPCMAAETTVRPVADICPCEAADMDGLLPSGPLLSPAQIEAVERINATGIRTDIPNHKLELPRNDNGTKGPDAVEII